MEHIEQAWQEELMQVVRVNNLSKLQVILNTRQQCIQQTSGRFSLDFKWKTINSVLIYSPVTLAIQQDHTEALELLLDAGASTDYLPFIVAPINEAIILQSTKMLRILLEYGADVSGQHGKLALHNAVSYNHQGTVALLLEYTSSGATYVHESWVQVCDESRTALLELFLNHAGINNITVPFDHIFLKGSLYSVDIMMKNGFFPSLCATSERLFTVAADHESTSTIRMLMVQRPLLLKLVKVKLQEMIKLFEHMGFNQREKYLLGMIESRAMLHCPSLQAQCKANIILDVGQRYMERVKQLPLPKPLIRYLQSLLSEIDFNTLSTPEQ